MNRLFNRSTPSWSFSTTRTLGRPVECPLSESQKSTSTRLNRSPAATTFKSAKAMLETCWRVLVDDRRVQWECLIACSGTFIHSVKRIDQRLYRDAILADPVKHGKTMCFTTLTLRGLPKELSFQHQLARSRPHAWKWHGPVTDSSENEEGVAVHFHVSRGFRRSMIRFPVIL